MVFPPRGDTIRFLYVKTGTAQYGATRFKCISMCSAQCLDSVVLKCVSHHIVTQFASPSAIVNPQGGSLAELSKSGPHNHIEE